MCFTPLTRVLFGASIQHWMKQTNPESMLVPGDVGVVSYAGVAEHVGGPLRHQDFDLVYRATELQEAQVEAWRKPGAAAPLVRQNVLKGGNRKPVKFRTSCYRYHVPVVNVSNASKFQKIMKCPTLHGYSLYSKHLLHSNCTGTVFVLFVPFGGFLMTHMFKRVKQNKMKAWH